MRIGMMTETFKAFVSQEESLGYIKRLGFGVADITLFRTGRHSEPDPDVFGGDHLRRAEEIRRYAREIGLPVVQAHAPFPVHRDGDEEYNRRMMEILAKCLDVCGILGVENLVVHPWNDWDHKENAAFFRELLPLAKRNGVVICTENMWNWDREKGLALPAACHSPEDFLTHVEEVGDPYLQACVDVGHANMFSHLDGSITPAEMVRVLGEHVRCFHIHDNDGIHDSHETPFTMSLDWDGLAEAVAEIRYEGDLIVEIGALKGGTLEQTLERNRLQAEAARRLVSLIREKERERDGSV